MGRRNPGALPIVATVLAGSLLSRPAGADDPPNYFSPGLIFSWGLGKNAGFGVGGEISFSHLNYGLVGYGEYLYGTYYPTPAYARFGLGAQLSEVVVGQEAGWALSTGRANFGASTGPEVGLFGSLGVIMLALRGAFSIVGDPAVMATVNLGIKAPISLQNGQFADLPFSFSSGRPHRIDGCVAIADPIAGPECAIDPSLIDNLGCSERMALGEMWLEDARLEHSAVAAFLTLAGELAALGAPPSLVRRALNASRDEVVHTRLCLEGARGHTGVTWALPAFHTPEPPRRSIRTLVTESWQDGCLGEGVAARAAREGAERCGQAWARGALGRIARDESTHADLAWRILEWCLSLPGEAGDEAHAALAEGLFRSRGSDLHGAALLDAATLRMHGRMPAAMMRTIVEQELESSRRLARSMLNCSRGARRDGRA